MLFLCINDEDGKNRSFPVWLLNQLISAGLEPVPSYTENINKYYRQI